MKDDEMACEPTRQPDELAPFFSAAKPLQRLSPDQGRTIKTRALESLLGKPSHGFRWRWSMALAALGLVLCGGAMASAAARYGLLPWARVVRPQVQSESKASRDRIPTRIRQPKAVEPAVAPVPVVPPSRASQQPAQAGEPPPPPSGYGRRARGSAVRSERTLASRSPSLLAREASAEAPVAEHAEAVTERSVMSAALRRLRREKDAAGALVLLEQLEISHPRSLLALERSNMQVEALLALGHEKEALSRLDGMALDDLPRSAERYLLRGELRAKFQHWSAACDDFEHALSQSSNTPVWYERALWGRGLTRLRAGDQIGGEADLKRYLGTYPRGRYAAAAERLLTPSR